MDSIADTNPDAYALVKALLTKRSLGLLYTRHATASFAAAPQQEIQASGGSHDWMNWEPKDSANNDEAMVKSVLGAVANLAQSKGLPMKAVSHSDNPLETEEATFGFSVVAPTSAPHKVSLASEEEAQQRAALSWHDVQKASGGCSRSDHKLLASIVTSEESLDDATTFIDACARSMLPAARELLSSMIVTSAR